MVDSIPLAKPYQEDKLPDCGFISIKYDGVPVRFDCRKGFVEACVSRSYSPLVSCFDIGGSIANLNPLKKFTIVGELLDTKVTGFKNVSGVVKRQSPQPTLYLNIFDYAEEGLFSEPFTDRYNKLNELYIWQRANRVYQYPYYSKQEGLELIQRLLAENPNIEGLIIKAFDTKFKPNKRHWDYLKLVIDPTLDLQVSHFEEAISKDGIPKNMVGSVYVYYKDNKVKVGAGKLTHSERKALWDKYQNRDISNLNLICTIKHKKDPQYTSALRQGTFQHWREDKDSPSYN